MTLSDGDIEARLRRTLAAVAEAPLDDPLVTTEPPRPRRTLAGMVLAAAAVVVVLVAVVAVAVVDRDGGDRVTTLTDQAEDGRTLLDYLPTDAEAALLFRAEQRLTRQCMESAGQPYVEVSPQSDGPEADWHRLGRTDPQRAERLGYVVPAGPGGKNPAQDRLTTAQQRDAWSLALTGELYAPSAGPTGPSVPIVHPVTGETTGGQVAGGCFGRVQRELYGDQSRHTSLEMWVTNEVRSEVEQQAGEDARFEDSVRAWSSCMRNRGHSYDDPSGPVHEFNAAGDAGQAGEAGRPTARELVVAHADIECKEATGLTRVYRELRTEHGRAVVARDGRLLSEYRQMVDRALAKAHATLD